MKKLLSAVMALLICVTMLCPMAFAGNNNVLNISKNNIMHEVSPTLYGVNLEDISNTFDGGLVSNLVNNNSFEYSSKLDFAWDFDGLKVSTDNKKPMNAYNNNYEMITVDGKGTARNMGYTEFYDGSQNNFNKDKSVKADMPFKKDTKYSFGCYLRNVDFEGTISVYLDSPTNSHRVNQLNTSGIGDKKWSYLYTTLTSVAQEDGALAIEFDGKGTILLDFVTLVDENSFGYGTHSWQYTSLRPDLFYALKNLKPSFLKFHPYGLSKDGTLNYLYNWKNTIGPVEERKQTANFYTNDDLGAYYNNSSFMGFHECMQLSKDLKAEPIPVVSVGILSSKQSEYDMYTDALNKLNMNDEQWEAYLANDRALSGSDIDKYTDEVNSLGIKSRDDYNSYIERIALTPGTDEFLNYAQDILDLIEYANADSKTSYWGALRGSNGSDDPFNIKYIALGDSYSDVYLRNFEALYNIIKAKYPDIQIIACGCANTDNDGQIYKTIAAKFSDVIIDEQIYGQKDSLYNANMKYDAYDRQANSVMLSKFGVKYTGRDTDISNNSLASALEESAFMTSLEKNSDVVKFSSYSPAMAKINSQDSKSNLIWFNSQKTVLTPNYFAQMLFSNNVGNKYIGTQRVNEKIYQSVTVDETTQTIYVKLVNTGAKSNVSVSLADFENINSVSSFSLSNKYLSAYNKANVNYIAPIYQNNIEFSNNGFDVTLGKNSVNVIRIAYGENLGAALYELPEGMDYKTSHYTPQDVKIAFVSVVVICIILAIGIGIFLKKYEAYKKRNKNK